MSLIIDTDIGSDVDDAFALTYAFQAGIDVKLITTVHGPVQERAYLAKYLTDLLGKEVPIAAGEALPIKQKQIFSSGLEKEITEYKPELINSNGVDALIKTIYDNKKVDIAALGPLTNIAKALQKEPGIAKCIGQIYIMGNAIIFPDNYYLNYRAHNLKVDPEAADIVLEAGMPITIVTTEVSKKNYLSKEELETLTGHPALDFLRNSAKKWLNFINYEQVYLYDPLVVQHYLDDNVTKKVGFGNVRITTGVDVSFKDKMLNTLWGLK